MIEPLELTNPDTDGAAQRASALLSQISAARAASRAAGDPNAEKIGADAERVAKDSIALANALEHGRTLGSAVVLYFAPDMSPADVLGRVSRLRLNVAIPGHVGAEPVSVEAPAALASPSSPAPASDPRQLSSPALGGEPPPAAGTPPAPAPAGPQRAEESAISIDAFDLSAEQIAGMPYDPDWIRVALADFKTAHAGEHAKRWITSFKAYLQKRPDVDANKRPEAA